MVIGTRQKRVTQDLNKINVRVDDTPIKRVQHTKSLGLIIDDNLQWKNHINAICQKISSPQDWQISHIRKIVHLFGSKEYVYIYSDE